jgi:hypothetical protein
MALLVVGGFLVLIGFLSLIRSRFLTVRRRLSPAATIRTRNSFGGRSAGSYSSGGGSSMWRGISFLLMAAGGALVFASIAMQ